MHLTLDSCREETGVEKFADRLVAQSVAAQGYENVVLLSRNQTARGDVAFYGCRCCLMEWNQPRFVKLRLTYQKAVWCDVVHPQVEGFRYTQTGRSK